MEKAPKNIVPDATVVFCDVVSFSNRDETKQFQIINSLNKRMSEFLDEHLSYDGFNPNILYLPTGDGMAVVFIAPSRFPKNPPFSLLDNLVEWIREGKARDEQLRKEGMKEDGVKLRIGVHHGTIYLITVNRYPNVCGATINECQRVMDAAHPNQVLISEKAFEEYVETIQEKYDYSPRPLEIIAKHNLRLYVRILWEKIGDKILATDKPYPNIIEGKEARTGFLAERIQEIKKMNGEELEGIYIYEQAAFSTFWISRKSLAGQENTNMGDLLVQQQEALNELVEKAGQFRMILNPKSRPDYPPRTKVARYKALLKWMDDHKSNSKIDWVESTAKIPNRLMISSKFCLEGYKLAPTSGYDLSLVHFDKEKLEKMITEFDEVFKEAKQVEPNRSKQGVIKRFIQYMKEEELKMKLSNHGISQRKKR
jgi:hypothetical protein